MSAKMSANITSFHKNGLRDVISLLAAYHLRITTLENFQKFSESLKSGHKSTRISFASVPAGKTKRVFE